jgi:ABC-type polysaccharide/polyol phosphate export permease
MAMIEELTQPFRKWRVWWLMSAQDIELRYKRSVLGPLWISASMLAFIIAISLLYSQIFGRPLKEYMIWLAPGYLTWMLIGSFFNEGSSSVTAHSSEVQNLSGFSMTSIASIVVSRGVIIFLHNSVVALGVMLVVGHTFTPYALMAIPGVLSLALIGLLIVVSLGPVCARFRDIPQVLTSLMQVIFFLTPVIWLPDARSIPEIIYTLNPFFHLVDVVRAPLIGQPYHPTTGVSMVIIFVTLLATSLWSLSVSRGRLALWA